MKPQNVSPEKYQALRARHATLKSERHELLQRLGSVRPGFHPALHAAEVAELEASVAAELGGAAYNRAASDLEGIRLFLEAELRLARPVFATPAPAEPAPLAGPSEADLAARVQAVLEYQAAVSAYHAAVGPAHARLSLAYTAARDAQQKVWAARKASGLYPPSRVTPQGDGHHPTVPATVQDIDHDLAVLAQQRSVPEQSGAASAAELRLRQLRHDRQEYDEQIAADAEADRINALPAHERRLELDRLQRAAAG